MREREREQRSFTARHNTARSRQKSHIPTKPGTAAAGIETSQSVTNGRFSVSDSLPGVASRCVWNTVLSNIDPYRVLSLLLQLGLNKVTSISQTSIISVASTAAPATLAPHPVRHWASLMVVHPSSIAASDWLKVWLTNVIDALIGPHAGVFTAACLGVLEE